MATARGKENARGRRVALIVGAVLVIAAVAVALWLAPTKEALRYVITTERELGPWGPVAFAAFYSIAVITLIPAAPLTLIAGIAYGAWAIPLVMIAAMIGALIAFLLSRYLLRDRVKKHLDRGSKLEAVDKVIGSDGWKIVTLLRLSPLIPFNVQNYILGASKIRFWPFALSTLLGMIPGTLVFVYLGAAGKATISSQDAGPLQWTLFVVGVIASIGVTWLITKKAKERLGKAGFKR